MLLQDQRDRAAKASHAVFMNRNQTRGGASRQHLGLHLRFDYRTEPTPGTREIADDDDALRSEPCYDHPHAAAKVVRHGFESLDGTRVALVGKTQEVLKT